MGTIKGRIYILVIVSVIFMHDVDLQRIKYVPRFRNFSMYSDIGVVQMGEVKIFQHNMEHRITAEANLTRNVITTKGIARLERCTFETFSCEYFQTWTFSANIFANLVKMKNQLWSPIFISISPTLEFPIIKKGTYRMTNTTFDANALVKFYPDAVKYYFKVYFDLYEKAERKAFTMYFEGMVFQTTKKKSR